MGSTFMIIGLPIIFAAFYSFFVSVFLSILPILWAFAEERKLEKQYGDSYREYKKKVGMFIPKI